MSDPNARTHVIRKEVIHNYTGGPNSNAARPKGQLNRKGNPTIGNGGQGIRIKNKFAGYAYGGRVKRDGKTIPVQEWVDLLNERAEPETKFVVERL